jgi:DNA-binding SARP family transcriptional activator
LNAIRLEPLREGATRTLITVHLAEQNVVEAIHRFEAFRDVLGRELGIAPSRELCELVEGAGARCREPVLQAAVTPR